jgi:hypothetical protein
MNNIFKEIQKDMDEWFEYMDSIVYEDGTEMEMTGVIASEHETPPLPITDEEAEDLEMRAELAYGI